MHATATRNVTLSRLMVARNCASVSLARWRLCSALAILRGDAVRGAPVLVRVVRDRCGVVGEAVGGWDAPGDLAGDCPRAHAAGSRPCTSGISSRTSAMGKSATALGLMVTPTQPLALPRASNWVAVKCVAAILMWAAVVCRYLCCLQHVGPALLHSALGCNREHCWKGPRERSRAARCGEPAAVLHRLAAPTRGSLVSAPLNFPPASRWHLPHMHGVDFVFVDRPPLTESDASAVLLVDAADMAAAAQRAAWRREGAPAATPAWAV